MFFKHVQMVKKTSFKKTTKLKTEYKCAKNSSKKISNFDDFKNIYYDKIFTFFFFTFLKIFPKKKPLCDSKLK